MGGKLELALRQLELGDMSNNCCGGGDGNGKEDPYALRRYAANSAVATLYGPDDSGPFELSLRDDRHLLFQFEGTVSRWRIELHPKNKLFDLSSLSDVVLGLNYTTREGEYELRKKAEWKTCGCGDGVERIRNEEGISRSVA